MSFFLKCEDGVYLSQRPLVFTLGEIGGSENPVGFDHFVRFRCRIKDISEPTFAPMQIIKCARNGPLIEGRGATFNPGITKLEPLMAIVK